MNRSGTNRLPRSGSPRSSEPGGRVGPAPDPAIRPADLVWELWNLRTLLPDADAQDLLAIKRDQERHLAREREALAGLWAGDKGILAPGHGFLRKNPDIRSGLVLSLHQGPYQLLAEPFLEAGHHVAILLNSRAMDSFKEGTRAMVRHLKLKGSLTWIPVGVKGFVGQLVREVRAGRLVLVYLDGNTGERGMGETRRRGLRYQLPGREIRLRTGLAKLACRLGCPVHRVSLHWDQKGGLVWRRDPTLRWDRRDDPQAATRQLFDWCFGRVLARPDQWQYWAMLRESSSCFAFRGLDGRGVPRGLRDDFHKAFTTCLERSPTTVKLILEKAVEIWPGDVLADLSEDRFYPAAGLQDSDLEPLRAGRPTLAELIDFHGLAWVRFHGLRLCLLGMARLGG